MDPVTAFLVGTPAGAAGVGGIVGPSLATSGVIGSAGAVSSGVLAATSLGTSLFGAASNAVGARQAAASQSASNLYNAKIAAQNAELASAEGNQRVAQSLAETRAKVGAITASQGASGVDVNTGSSSRVRESASKIGALDALTIRGNATREAYGYSAQSSLSTAEAKNAKKAGNINAAASVLGGVGEAGTNYAEFLAKNSVV